MDLWEFVSNIGNVSYNEDAKRTFKKVGQKFLKDVLAELPDVKESRIGYNPGGIAVSGDHSLYVMFNDGKGACMFFNCDGVCNFVTMRSIQHLHDYGGGINNNFPYDVLASKYETAKRLASARLRG